MQHHYPGTLCEKKAHREYSNATLKFTVIPTGVGDNITVHCLYCDKGKVVLTLDDDGEFLCNYDKDWNEVRE